jgi:hypothetical protein
MGASNNELQNGIQSEHRSAVNRYVNSLDNKTNVKNIAGAIMSGTTPKASDEEVSSVRALLDAVKIHSTIPPADNRDSLVSGVNHQGNLPKVGAVVSHPISSATTDLRIAQRFATSGPGKPVIYHYSHKTPRMSVSGMSMFGDEQEHLVSGVFHVSDRQKVNGITHIYLRPAEQNNAQK